MTLLRTGGVEINAWRKKKTLRNTSHIQGRLLFRHQEEFKGQCETFSYTFRLFNAGKKQEIAHFMIHGGRAGWLSMISDSHPERS